MTSETRDKRATEAGLIQPGRRGPEPRPALPYHGRLESVTDANGAYRIEGIPCSRGGTSVGLALAGYKSEDCPLVSVTLEPGGNATAPDITIDLRSTWSCMKGRVVNLAGEPLPRAVISDGLSSTHAAADGHFELRVAKELASTCLKISAPGHQTQRILFDRLGSEEPTITLLPAARFSVEVRDSEGLLAPGVQVLVMRAGELDRSLDRPHWAPATSDGLSATTDSRGLVSFDASPDTVDLAARVLRGGQILECVRRHNLSIGELKEPLEIRLLRTRLSEASHSVKVRIVDELSQRAIARDAKVVLWREEVREREGRANRGTIEFHQLDETPLRIEVMPLGSPSVFQYWDPRTSPATCDIIIPAGLQLSGEVRGRDGSPVSQTWVLARREGERDSICALTDRLGQFEFTGLSAGTYHLWSSPPSCGDESTLGEPSSEADVSGLVSVATLTENVRGVILAGSRWEVAELSLQLPASIVPQIDGAGEAGFEWIAEWAMGLEAAISGPLATDTRRMQIVSMTNRSILFRALMPGRDFQVVVRSQGRVIASTAGQCGRRVSAQASP